VLAQKIGKIRSHTCYPPSMFRLGFRTTSISGLLMLRSTAKIPTSTRQPGLASAELGGRRIGGQASIYHGDADDDLGVIFPFLTLEDIDGS
jgi:hypothetical protein